MKNIHPRQHRLVRSDQSFVRLIFLSVRKCCRHSIDRYGRKNAGHRGRIGLQLTGEQVGNLPGPEWMQVNIRRSDGRKRKPRTCRWAGVQRLSRRCNGMAYVMIANRPPVFIRGWSIRFESGCSRFWMSMAKSQSRRHRECARICAEKLRPTRSNWCGRFMESSE